MSVGDGKNRSFDRKFDTIVWKIHEAIFIIFAVVLLPGVIATSMELPHPFVMLYNVFFVEMPKDAREISIMADIKVLQEVVDKYFEENEKYPTGIELQGNAEYPLDYEVLVGKYLTNKPREKNGYYVINNKGEVYFKKDQ